MRRLARVLVAATSALAALLTLVPAALGPDAAASASGGGTATIDAAFIHRVVFLEPMRSFMSIAANRFGPSGRGNDTWFDWSTDNCSAPLLGNSGWSYDFTAACRRHDFAYRNTKLLDRRYGGGHWNSGSRRLIDAQFLRDMQNSCWSRSVALLPSCMSWAYAYYGAVRTFGGP